jgi:hypothetical protein
MNPPSPKKGRNPEANGILPGKHRVMVYLRRCLSVVTDTAVLPVVKIAISMAALHIGKVLWCLYMAKASVSSLFSFSRKPHRALPISWRWISSGCPSRLRFTHSLSLLPSARDAGFFNSGGISTSNSGLWE